MGNEIHKDEKVEECRQKHARWISEEVSDKMYNSIVKIENNVNNKIGTGFFMKVNINDKTLKFLLTCYHIISKDLVDKLAVIDIISGKENNESKIKIKLEKSRRLIKCFDKPIDVTFIEILDGDNILNDKFLFLDFNFKNGYDFYKNANIYSASYPMYKKVYRCVCSGEIKKIDEIEEFPGIFEFEHSLDTYFGSSGSPVCLGDNLCVIGVHKGSNQKGVINYGTFIGNLLEKIDIDKKEENNKNINKKDNYRNNFNDKNNKSITIINDKINEQNGKNNNSINKNSNDKNNTTSNDIKNNNNKNNTMMLRIIIIIKMIKIILLVMKQKLLIQITQTIIIG